MLKLIGVIIVLIIVDKLIKTHNYVDEAINNELTIIKTNIK